MQILLGGGQEAMSVTTTSARQGKFETRFWHKVLEEEVGRVKGHFGPINTYVSPQRAWESQTLNTFIESPFILPASHTLLAVRTVSFESITLTRVTLKQNPTAISGRWRTDGMTDSDMLLYCNFCYSIYSF